MGDCCRGSKTRLTKSLVRLPRRSNVSFTFFPRGIIFYKKARTARINVQRNRGGEHRSYVTICERTSMSRYRKEQYRGSNDAPDTRAGNDRRGLASNSATESASLVPCSSRVCTRARARTRNEARPLLHPSSEDIAARNQDETLALSRGGKL